MRSWRNVRRRGARSTPIQKFPVSNPDAGLCTRRLRPACWNIDGTAARLGSSEHVAPERRTVSREALKAWIGRAFPASKPAFLFDEVERNTHSAINADSYRVLKAAHDAKVQALEQANERIRKLVDEKWQIESELSSLRVIVEEKCTR